MSDLLLVAAMAGRRVAIATEEVASVVDLPLIVPVPCAAAPIRGLTTLRSRVATVIDPTALLGGPGSANESRRAVITRLDEHLYAVLVDSVADVVPLARIDVPSGLRMPPEWAAIATGMFDHAGEPVLGIALSRLIARVCEVAHAAAA